MPTIDTARLREVLNYDPETGIFTNRRHGKGLPKAGKVAGCLDKSTGYIRIRIDGALHHAHRLAWQYVHGSLPPHDVDHRNRIRSDNRLDNLREADDTQNARNSGMPSTNTSGIKGVSWRADRQKWRATIKLGGKQLFLGHFDAIADAAEAREAAARKHHGEFMAVANDDQRLSKAV